MGTEVVDGGGGEKESGEKMKKAIGVEREVMQQKNWRQMGKSSYSLLPHNQLV